jgi:predicted nicotinamide N-methyase
VRETLAPNGGVAWVTFSHHDPHKAEKDLNFFALAESAEFGFRVVKMEAEARQSYPFVERDGMDEERGVVYVYTLTLP